MCYLAALGNGSDSDIYRYSDKLCKLKFGFSIDKVNCFLFQKGRWGILNCSFKFVTKSPN